MCLDAPDTSPVGTNIVLRQEFCLMHIRIWNVGGSLLAVLAKSALKTKNLGNYDILVGIATSQRIHTDVSNLGLETLE